jgi:RNA polymerase sigma-70 factor, ECF subfamily
MSAEAFNSTYVQKLAQGDQDTARHFLESFDGLLTLKLRSRLRSKHAVEDIRQETYARVFLALKTKDRINRPERLGAFVHSVCNHVLLEFYRSDKRTQPFPANDYEPPDQCGDIESSLVNEERRQQLAAMVADLPAKDREILHLLFYDECDKDEVCRKLNVDRGYLRVLVHRATSKLRRNSTPLRLTA